MENKIVPTVKNEIEEIKITNDDVRKYFCGTATETEMGLFINIAKLNGLNPFKREIYLVKYGSYPASIITGFESYLKRAERTGKLSGWKVWTEGDIPDMKACIEINRKDWDKPFYHEVEYSEYVAKKSDGSVTRFWLEKPKTMLKKVVMAQGFRFAFSDELAGLPYVREELNTLDLQEVTPKTSSKPVVQAPKEEIIPEQEVDVESDIKSNNPLPDESKKNLQAIRDLMAKCQTLEELKQLWEQETMDYQEKFLPNDYEKAGISKNYFKKILSSKTTPIEKKNKQ